MSYAINLLFVMIFGATSVFLILGIVIGYLVFRHLINAQIKRWALSKRGYVEVEHISPTRVRSYFILKPKEGKFDIYDGFYHYIPDAITQGGQILKHYKVMDQNFHFLKNEDYEKLDEKAKKKYDDELLKFNAEMEDRKKLGELVGRLNFKGEATSWKYGMPIITYYGDNPDPILFSDRQKTFGSGVIKDMYIRLMLTQKYKDFQMMMILGILGIFIGVIGVIVIYFKLSSVSKIDSHMLTQCMDMLNYTQSTLQHYVRSNSVAMLQNSTLTI